MASKHFKCIEHVIPAQHIRNYAQATAHTQEEELQLSIKQYIPHKKLDTASTSITLIATHANGFSRELYEPLLDDLFGLCNEHNLHIRSIWFADSVHQGASGLLNADKLGNEPSPFDHSRDLLLMINHFRREMIMPIFGFAHSMGGLSLLQLSLIHPRLFQGLILIDPTVRSRPSIDGFAMRVGYLGTFRKDRWSSRESAAKYFRSIPFYKTWDPRVLDRFLQYSLRNLDESRDSSEEEEATTSARPVVLTTTKEQEAFSAARPAYPADTNASLRTFVPSRLAQPDLWGANATGYIYAEPVPFYRPESSFIFAQLQHLRPHVLILSPATSTVSTPLERTELLATMGRGQGGSGGIDERAVTETIIHDSDHFVPFTQPQVVAEKTAMWLKGESASWQAHEAAAWKSWVSIPDADKRSFNKDWKFWMKKHFGGGKNGPRSKL